MDITVPEGRLFSTQKHTDIETVSPQILVKGGSLFLSGMVVMVTRQEEQNSSRLELCFCGTAPAVSRK